MSALELLRAGKDTMQIAEILGVPEYVASRMVYEQRCRERDLPMRYERHVRRPA